MFKYIALLVFYLCGLNAQDFIFDMCPNDVTYQKNFDLDRFLGTWYEAKTYPHKYENGIRCTEVSFTNGAKENTVNIDVQWKDNRNVQHQLLSNGSVETNENFAAIDSSIPIPLKPSYFVDYGTDRYIILGTDYENYAVLGAFAENQILFSFFCSENVWVLTRERNPSTEVLNMAMEPFQRNKYLKKWKLRNSNQKNC